MVCHKKRGLILVSAFFALVYSILLIALNGIVLVSRVLEKLAEEGEATLLEGFPILEDLQVYINGLEGQEAGLFPIASIALLVVGVFAFVLAIKAFKKPIKEDGSVTYRGGIQFFTFIFSAITIVLCFLGSQQEALKEANETLATICFVFVGIAAASVLFEIFSLLVRKNVFKTKTVVKPNYKQNVALSVLGVEEKLKKIQQLTDDLNNAMRENISGVRVIRAFNAEKYQSDKFMVTNVSVTKNHLFTARLMGIMMPMMTMCMSGLTLSIYWIAAVLINKAEILVPSKAISFNVSILPSF